MNDFSSVPLRPTDHARRVLRRAESALAWFAVLVSVVVGIATALGRDPAQDAPDLAGPLAGLVTLAVCWALLAAGAAWWHRRLDALDELHWTAEWARVEPRWSGSDR